jgi:outer membrane immunogenic protein
MKKVLLASAACFAFACGSAVAADMPVKAPIMKAAPSVSWTGCYVGVEMGAKWDRVKSTDNGNINGVPNGIAPGTQINGPFDSSGVFGGGTLGCNYQVTNFVFGLEGDFSGSDSIGTGHDNTPLFNPLVQENVRERWLGTARARLGVLWDPNTLLYVTGGGAWSSFNNTLQLGGVVASENDSVWGWTVGAGVEYMLPGSNWSAKAEYAYIQFQNYNMFTTNSPGFDARNTNVAEHLFRVGLNYHFGMGGPVVAKY